MTYSKFLATTVVCTTALFLNASNAHAHAIAGDRIFPATLAIDDPGVSDEMTLPQITVFKSKDDDGAAHWGSETDAEFDKRITDKLALSISGAYDHNQGGPDGFDNVGLGAKYNFLTDADHETMMSVGLDADIGNTGSHDVGEKHSSFTPALFAGKGFGDLPDSMDWLKPFAVTGTAGVGLPAGGDDAKTLKYGFTLQYSLPYLQQHIKDIGLPQPVAGIIPIVEFAFSTPISQNEHTTTGTINPGFIWMGSKMQFGVEAVLPASSATGSGVGVTAQVHFFLDDMFPTSIGRPIFGGVQ